jgi:2-methylaconitate cis-trans-isomerase PrpF
MIAAGAPAALFAAEELDLTGADSLPDIAERLPLLVDLRRRSALQMGLSRPEDPITHAIPKVGV